MLLTQVELEEEAHLLGRKKAAAMLQRNEETGQAQNNPYAQSVYRKYMLPLEELLAQEVKSIGKAGRRAAHVTLLKDLNPRAVAYITTRIVMSAVMESKSTARQIAVTAARSIYSELVLSRFNIEEPDLYYTLVHDLDRKHSKNLRHRTYVLTSQAIKAEVQIPVWSNDDQHQVGLWLLEQLAKVGMVDITRQITYRKTGAAKHTFDVLLSDEAMNLIDSIKSFITVTLPHHVPAVECPRDWVAVNDGGYHTTAMRRSMPYMVGIARHTETATLEFFKTHDLQPTFDALNKLQRTEWKVNVPILDVILKVAKHFDMEEIISQAELPQPHKPEWLSGEMDKSTMSESQLEEFNQWKHMKAEWYTQMKLRGAKWGRFYAATRMAEKFRDYPKIHFIYQCDFRGRYYAVGNSLTPQGSDLQKAMLQFANGKPLHTPSSVTFFKMHGANKFGVDKETLENRTAWVDAHSQMIIACAEDPINNRQWTEADCPLQFLAWCLEYAAWIKDPEHFLNFLAIGMDGSCNGLQHFSAMLRDTRGAAAVNLTPGLRPSDIYKQVAEVVMATLAKVPEEEDSPYRTMWLNHKVTRSLVKRSVMTLPYGSTRFSCQDFIVDDYLKHGKAPELEKSEYMKAAHFLSFVVWEAIGEVVVASRQAMDWLQSSAEAIITAGGQQIHWVTPSGFPVIQVYQVGELHRINTKLLGNVKLVINRHTDQASAKKHRQGLAPNFVHSMDAAHCTMVINAATGIDSLHMIHDDFGTHAADSEQFYGIIREQFIKLYSENKPLVQFYAKYKDSITPPPEEGTLDITAVRSSRYFFL